MLIPVDQALSKIERYMEQHPDEDDVPDEQEVQWMVRVLLDYCWERVALRTYAAVLTGKPNSN